MSRKIPQDILALADWRRPDPNIKINRDNLVLYMRRIREAGRQFILAGPKDRQVKASSLYCLWGDALHHAGWLQARRALQSPLPPFSIYQEYQQAARQYNLRVEGRTIVYITDRVFLYDEDDNEYDMGTYRVEIRPDGIRIRNHEAPTFSVGNPHPHVDSSGYPCFGDWGPAITAALRDHRIVDLCGMLWTYLNSYDGSGVYERLEMFAAQRCHICGTSDTIAGCDGCGLPFCLDCSIELDCGQLVCDDCAVRCEACEALVVPGDRTNCPCCNESCCSECMNICPRCGGWRCPSCSVDARGKEACEACTVSCTDCMDRILDTECSECEDCGETLCSDCWCACDECEYLFCSNCLEDGLCKDCQPEPEPVPTHERDAHEHTQD